MRKLYIPIVIAALLAGCAHLAPIDPTAPPPTTAELAAAQAAVKQANFDMVCKYAGGAWAIAKPVAQVPAVKAKLGVDGALAVQALNTFVTTTCGTPLDINNADAIIQRGYDIGGQVVALVISAQSQ